jgi:ABC-type transporter Mla MlaB component
MQTRTLVCRLRIEACKANSWKKLKATIHQTGGDAVTLKIEGKLSGLHVPELHRAWQEFAPTLGVRKLLVDLRGVLHVDGSGRDLLAAIHARTGAEFLADTPLTKYFAEQARQKIVSDPNL